MLVNDIAGSSRSYEDMSNFLFNVGRLTYYVFGVRATIKFAKFGAWLSDTRIDKMLRWDCTLSWSMLEFEVKLMAFFLFNELAIILSSLLNFAFYSPLQAVDLKISAWFVNKIGFNFA